ncbi:hypothetical protein AOQ84DRAFT_418010 [Glonium stellatum]|uniref:DUF8021 domain-containing protein n=1 Tax=Glonium stellatum TaxID=574774 RepID=A0A8E2ESJ8_9PEZI|nr:hypothetical protein AOQ84DRAFT_418010 [Glonium stellatum]
MLYSIVLVCLAATVSADCSREFLQNATDKYVAAQSAGQSATISALATSNLTYMENAKAANIKNGTLSQPIKIDFNRSVHDTVQCATFTELIASTNAKPYVIHTRMVFTDQKATLIESIVTQKGDWLFNATGTLTLNAQEKWDPIPKDRQDTRAVIKAVGDSYFDRFGNTSVRVPWGPPCYRLEGGLAARGNLTGDNCVMEWPSTIHIPYRRYVIDEQMGVVDIFVGFPGLDRTQGQNPMPDSHVFRVENGKIRYLHTASACVKAGCGLNGTLGMRY